MATAIAFIRGINVGGKAKLPMKDLVRILEGIGIHGAVTYLQSGNVAFRCTKVQREELARRIGSAIMSHSNFQPQVVVTSIQEVEHAVAANPYPEARQDPKSLHLWFLADVPAKADLEKLSAVKSETERFELHRKIFYLHAPDGLGQSRLATRVEKCLGVTATARNWRTVTKTLQMAWDLA
jgi:uncharacterized protein (DUF1697 family)